MPFVSLTAKKRIEDILLITVANFNWKPLRIKPEASHLRSSEAY